MHLRSALRTPRSQFVPRLEALEDRYCPAAPTVSVSSMACGPHLYRLTGSVMDEAPAGLTVNFTGVYVGSAVTNSMGWFDVQVQPSQLGTINAKVTDAQGLDGAASTVVTSAAPAISGFMAIRSVNNIWTFCGTVMDEHAQGLTVRFGGLPTLEGKQTVITDSSGHFSFTIEMPDGEIGVATAITTDWWGQDSNEAEYSFFPSL